MKCGRAEACRNLIAASLKKANWFRTPLYSPSLMQIVRSYPTACLSVYDRHERLCSKTHEDLLVLIFSVSMLGGESTQTLLPALDLCKSLAARVN